MRINKRVFCFLCLFFAAVLFASGCESVRKKFTRQRKFKESQEEMVIVPRDYSAHPFPHDVLYKQYFIYWKSWSQEIVESLNYDASPKKVFSCATEASVNLRKMQSFLTEEKAKELEVYIKQADDFKEDISEAVVLTPSLRNALRYKAERILSAVNRQFDLRKMKPFLK